MLQWPLRLHVVTLLCERADFVHRWHQPAKFGISAQTALLNLQVGLPVLGVVENMSGLTQPVGNLTFRDASGANVTASVLQAVQSVLPNSQVCLAWCFADRC